MRGEKNYFLNRYVCVRRHRRTTLYIDKLGSECERKKRKINRKKWEHRWFASVNRRNVGLVKSAWFIFESIRSFIDSSAHWTNERTKENKNDDERRKVKWQIVILGCILSVSCSWWWKRKKKKSVFSRDTFIWNQVHARRQARAKCDEHMHIVQSVACITDRRTTISLSLFCLLCFAIYTCSFTSILECNLCEGMHTYAPDVQHTMATWIFLAEKDVKKKNINK